MTWTVDAIVWDFDGVVVDTSRDIANAANYALRKLGLPEQPVETLASYIGGGAEPLVRKMLGEKAAVLKTLEAMASTASRAVMIGDTAADIGAGRAAGAVTVGVTYGYGSREEVAGAGPDLLIETATELLDHIF